MAAQRLVTLRQIRNLVRGLRIERQLTQQDLADRAGVSRQWLGEFERGKPNVEAAPVLAVLDVLDIRLTASWDDVTAESHETDERHEVT